MLITELGIVIDVKLEQRLNALSPMLVMELGITVFLQPAIRVFVAVSIMALQLFLLSYFALPSSTEIDVKPEQLPKASFAILVTELGMVIEIKSKQD